MGDYALEYGLGIGINYENFVQIFLYLVCCSFCAPSWHLKLSLSLSTTRRKLSSEQVQ